MSEVLAPPADTAQACYHCGLPIAAGVHHVVRLGGVSQRMCCAGCAAVAQAIADAGLGDYYRHRDALPDSRREAMPPDLEELGLFDHPEFQKSFVRPVGEGEREADLILEGITCAACVWLNEQHLAKLPGVTAVQVNYATRRARVRWREAEIALSKILAAVAAIGYRAHPFDPHKTELVAQSERRSALWRLLVAGFGMMQVMMYAYPVYIAKPGEMTADVEYLMRWASLALTLPVVLYSAAPFFRRAWRDVRLRHLGMDVPVALGVGAAFLASLWATLTGGPEVYYDSVTMFVFLLLCGRYLEMLARQRAVRGTEELGRIVPAFAEHLPHWPDETGERVPASLLQPGDVLRIRPGEAVPADGEILDGRSELDESWLTGESRPRARSVGDEVAAGSVNGGSPLVIRASAVGEGTRIASVRQLVARAQAERPRIVEQADRVASHFVVALLVLAIFTAIFWGLHDPARAVWIFTSVLVVSCPCALSLATPVALTVATERMGRLGLLVTRGHAIEALARADLFAFDKTGTLTEGRLRLVEIRSLGGASQDDVLALAATLERGAEHAIARAVVEAAEARGLRLPAVRECVAVTGRGVEGLGAEGRLRIGNPGFVAEIAPLPSDDFGGRSRVWLARDGQGLGILFFEDALRADAAESLRTLEGEGARIAMLSGDAPEVVRDVAAQLGIADARGGLLPQDKHEAVRAWQSRGHTVAMLGDGVNDAPVLAQAQVSIAIGGGTELARTHADVVLLGERLAPLPAGRRLARRTMRVVRQNLAWSFGYNVLAIPLAMAGWVTPWMAGIGMSASSLLVVLNALRLLRAEAPGKAVPIPAKAR
ncbi:heavy metal translocating P-type ATPase [Niveibacterium sp. SC-1]|uniref:heavy metal translocating P-type ATPase n=1 Tax=Niveibacterium sp. SC-1 TaxID=3135646 RepID=UPI00311DFC67